MTATRMFAVLLTGLVLIPPSSAAQGITQETVRWETGDVPLEGTLYLPGRSGRHTCAVFIHGSGGLTRSEPLYRHHAERLAALGMAMLVYDKRGTGRSGGDWRKATLADLAEDALGAVRELRTHASIAPDRIGLFGASQGGWIALMAASKDRGIAFLVTLSGPTITPADQTSFIVEAAMRSKGHSDAAVGRALELDRQIAQVYRTNTGWEEARVAVQRASAEPWFADAGVGIQATDSWNWKWYRDLPMDFDPAPLFAALTIPVFAAHGERDALVPAARSAEDLRVLAKSGKDFTAEVFPGVGHVLHGPTGGASRSWRAPDEYWASLAAWLRTRSLVPANRRPFGMLRTPTGFPPVV